MKVIIAAGGTGGHVYPAIAIGQEFRKNGIDVIFIGRKGSYEEEKFLFYGFKVLNIIASQLYLNPIVILKFFYTFIKGTMQAVSILRRENPKFVIGVGGYVSAPIIFASILLRKTFFLQEQNIIPGRANRIFCKFAKCIFTGFPDSYNFFKGKSVFSGNPIREEIKTIDRAKAIRIFGFEETRPTLLIYGGSGGSKKINEISIELIPEIIKEIDLNIIFITGEKFSNEVKDKIPKDARIKVFSYLEEMNSAYSICDFAITRAGAMTLVELSYFGIPSIVIPFPFARNNHQRKNAEYLKNKGCIEIIDEKDLNKEILKKHVIYYFKQIDIMKNKSKLCYDAFPHNSTEIIFQKIMEMIGEESFHGRS